MHVIADLTNLGLMLSRLATEVLKDPTILNISKTEVGLMKNWSWFGTRLFNAVMVQFG